MANVRRWYIFLVCAVSLQSTVWAVIALLRNLLLPNFDAPLGAIAFQIAVIVIGLPVFLGHWLWAQRLARQDDEERSSAVRRLYVYGSLAAFLGAFLANAFGLADSLLGVALGGRSRLPPEMIFDTFSLGQVVVQALVAMVVLALMWLYHQRVAAEDARAAPETGNAGAVRRLYILGFSATGLTLTMMGAINLLRWILVQFGALTVNSVIPTPEVVRLVVGVPLWLVFWQAAQRLFRGPSEEERESILRKLYLYAAVFIGALSVVVNVTFILAGILRRALGLESIGDIRQPLSLIVGMGLLWAYHAYALRGDAALAGEAPRQAGVRRLYGYLVAAVGLATALIGLGGDVSVLIRLLGPQVLGDGLREQLAWFTAALIAGTPVWLLPWRTVQSKSAASGAAGVDERRSVVRKIYLYFFLFAATMTILSSAVYILYLLLTQLLGAYNGGGLLSDLAQAVAYGLIGVALWLYHGSEVRRDNRLNRSEQAGRMANLKVAVVDVDDGRFGRSLLDRLRRELPGLGLVPIGLTPAAQEAMGAASGDGVEQLAGAGLLVGPWTMTVAGGAGGAVTPALAGAVLAAPARKLLVPVRADGWDWAGVDRWNAEAVLHQTVQAIKQVVEGEEVKPVRPIGCGALAGIVGGVLVLLVILVPVVYLLFFNRLF